MLVSIDLSLRSTGVCVFGDKGNLTAFKVITPSPKEWNDEALLMHIATSIVDFVKDYPVTAIVIEGLSYNSFSSEKDKLAGNFWHLRCSLKGAFPDAPIGIISVAEWRASVITKLEQREIKKSTEKDAIKKACVMRLPKNIDERFSTYLSDECKPAKCKFDLVDAYYLGVYRLSLGV